MPSGCTTTLMPITAHPFLVQHWTSPHYLAHLLTSNSPISHFLNGGLQIWSLFSLLMLPLPPAHSLSRCLPSAPRIPPHNRAMMTRTIPILLQGEIQWWGLFLPLTQWQWHCHHHRTAVDPMTSCFDDYSAKITNNAMPMAAYTLNAPPHPIQQQAFFWK